MILPVLHLIGREQGVQEGGPLRLCACFRLLLARDERVVDQRVHAGFRAEEARVGLGGVDAPEVDGLALEGCDPVDDVLERADRLRVRLDHRVEVESERRLADDVEREARQHGVDVEDGRGAAREGGGALVERVEQRAGAGGHVREQAADEAEREEGLHCAAVDAPEGRGGVPCAGDLVLHGEEAEAAHLAEGGLRERGFREVADLLDDQGIAEDEVVSAGKGAELDDGAVQMAPAGGLEVERDAGGEPEARAVGEAKHLA